MKNSLSMLQYLLLALLLFALTGCGASNLAGTGNNSAPGNISAKLVWGADKTTAKTVAAIPAGVTKLNLTVTGSDANGNALPVVKSTLTVSSGTASGTINGIYPGMVALAVQASDNSGNVLFEGYALRLQIVSGQTTNASVTMTPPVVKAENVACLGCHETTLDATGQSVVANYKQSGHYTNTTFALSNISSASVHNHGAKQAGCAGCHGTNHNDPTPDASGRCYECHGVNGINPQHTAGVVPNITPTGIYLNGSVTVCGTCHQPHNSKGPIVGGSCVKCHSVAQNFTDRPDANYVNDNNGVRAITTEFTKWSHHVTGVTLNDAHCAACHLEGTVNNGQVIVDVNVHMSSPQVHLRNADTDADMVWDPANPNHATIDNFCMSCHDGNGATSPMSQQIQAFINNNHINATGKTASAINPFGDTISNRYDKMQRPAVTNVYDQFAPTNNSHHGVRGKRYSGRTRLAGARQIASPATFAANSSSSLKGARSTIYDAGNFNALYSPLGTDGTAATGLGDDSTIHCGDCHTVGQWAVGVTDTANGSSNPAAIGAHGSNNEYLLRNTLGTDQRHTQNAYTLSATNVVSYTNPNSAFLVCYNCHAYTRYGSIYVGTGLNIGAGQQPHAGEYDQAGRCNGIGDTLPFNGYTTGKATDGTQFVSRFTGPISKYGTTPAFAPGFPLSSGTGANTIFAPPAGEQDPDFGNVFGIQCLNCHNAGVGNAYGGIHGSAKNTNTATKTVNASVTGGAYIDGMGNTTKVERFLPGLNNTMHVPGTLGGFTGGTTAFTNGSTASSGTYTTGGISNDTNWEQKHWQQTPTTNFNLATGAVTGTSTTATGAGCYTLGTSTSTSTNITAGQSGPSVTGQGGAATTVYNTWGGCTDHTAAQGNGNHGFAKRILRPVTY